RRSSDLRYIRETETTSKECFNGLERAAGPGGGSRRPLRQCLEGDSGSSATARLGQSTVMGRQGRQGRPPAPRGAEYGIVLRGARRPGAVLRAAELRHR